MLQFFEQVLIEIGEGPEIAVVVSILSDGDNPIVTDRLPVLGLLRFDHADQTGRHDAARKSRFIHQEQDVDRIAVLRFSARDETKIVRKYGARGQDGTKLEPTEFLVVLESVAAAARCLDNDIGDFAIVIERLGQTPRQFPAH